MSYALSPGATCSPMPTVARSPFSARVARHARFNCPLLFGTYFAHCKTATRLPMVHVFRSRKAKNDGFLQPLPFFALCGSPRSEPASNYPLSFTGFVMRMPLMRSIAALPSTLCKPPLATPASLLLDATSTPAPMTAPAASCPSKKTEVRAQQVCNRGYRLGFFNV